VAPFFPDTVYIHAYKKRRLLYFVNFVVLHNGKVTNKYLIFNK